MNDQDKAVTYGCLIATAILMFLAGMGFAVALYLFYVLVLMWHI